MTPAAPDTKALSDGVLIKFMMIWMILTMQNAAKTIPVIFVA